jgi:hypothetical protein
MSLISYWPAPGLLVPFPGPADAPLSASGAQAVPTDYLSQLTFQGKLLTSNPNGSTTPAPVDYFQFALYCTTLMTSVGVFGGQVVDVIGYRSKADGGQGQFTWDATTTVPADNGTVFGSQPVGRWVRVRPSHELNLKWWGAYGDSVTDDTAAVRAAIAAVTTESSEIYVPRGTYGLTDSVFVGSTTLGPGGIRFTGEGAGLSNNQWPTFKWIGVAAKKAGALFYVNSYDHWFKQIRFSGETNDPANVKECGVSVGGGYTGLNVGQNGASHIVFERCAFVGFEVGCAIDYLGVIVNNLELCRWVECAFATYNVGLWVRDAQPYSTRVEKCLFNQNRPSWLSSGGGNPHGVGIRTGNPGDTNIACTLWISDVNFSYMTYGLQMLGTPAAVHIQDVDSENCKKLVYQTGPSGVNNQCTLQGGRYDISAIYSSKPGLMYDFHEDVAGSDGAYIDVYTMPITIMGNTFFSVYVDTPLFRVKVGGSVNLTSINNIYPTGNPFQRTLSNVLSTAADGVTTAAFVGRTISDNDRAFGTQNPYFTAGGWTAVNLPRLDGCENGSGTVTISGAATTTATVTFTNAEWAYNLTSGAVDYRVDLTIQDATSGAVISTPYVSNKTTAGFTVNVVTAPGASKTLTIAYHLRRD